jgi:hypothetical protein
MADAPPPPTMSAVLARLRAYREATGESLSGLALRAGLSRSALLGMDDVNWSPTSTTVEAVEKLIPKGWQAGHPLPARRAKATAESKAA